MFQRLVAVSGITSPSRRRNEPALAVVQVSLLPTQGTGYLVLWREVSEVWNGLDTRRASGGLGTPQQVQGVGEEMSVKEDVAKVSSYLHDDGEVIWLTIATEALSRLEKLARLGEKATVMCPEESWSANQYYTKFGKEFAKVVWEHLKQQEKPNA
jgi:hypothetical protein